jgi:hypothetical protein
MAWLRETHLPGLAERFVNGSALLFGNEDLPARIWVYEENDPTINDHPLIFILDSETCKYNGTKWE